VAHPLLDGRKPSPKATGKTCDVTELPHVEEAARLPKGLTDGVVKYQSSLDTFCPGFDVS
jgi:hypothetical protein